MFHRVRSEAPQPQSQPQAQNPQGPRPQNQSPVQSLSNQNAAPQQSATPQDTAARFEEYKQQQNPAAEQDKAPARTEPSAQPQQQTTQQQPTNNSTNNQEDAPVMTTNPTQPANTQGNTSEDYSAPRALDIPASPYQRSGQAPVRAGAGYPGAYPAAAYPGRTPTPAQTPSVSAGDRRLIIGRGISISGEIESCDHLIVEGTVEAALKGASVLEIAENGTFYGTVDIQDATIAGRFEGDIVVHGRLTIRTTGTITGTITYKELEIEAGAVIDGRLTPVGAQNEARKSSHNNKSGKKGHQSSAGNDGGLFNTKAAAE